MKKQIARLQFLTCNLPGLSHARQAAAVCEGGIRWVQFRMKEGTRAQKKDAAIEVRSITQRYGATLIINDDVWLAKEIRADGVHLGKSDMPVSEARSILGDEAIIGGTANTVEDVIKLSQNGADYIGLGPFRYTDTKKNLSPILGLEGYRSITAQLLDAGVHLPIIAIGGIQYEDIAGLTASGVFGLAVSSAIHSATDMTSTARKWQTAISHYTNQTLSIL